MSRQQEFSDLKISLRNYFHSRLSTSKVAFHLELNKTLFFSLQLRIVIFSIFSSQNNLKHLSEQKYLQIMSWEFRRTFLKLNKQIKTIWRMKIKQTPPLTRSKIPHVLQYIISLDIDIKLLAMTWFFPNEATGMDFLWSRSAYRALAMMGFRQSVYHGKAFYNHTLH